MAFILFVGDFVRPVGASKFHEVVDTDGDMQVRLDDGRWCWADEGDITAAMSSAEYWKSIK